MWFINLFEDSVNLANRYGISLLLILSVLFTIRIVISSQARWSEREKFYYDILKNLGIWKDSLSDRLDYYQQPGSEYDTEHENKPYFLARSEQGRNAYQNIREQVNIGRIFLSDKSIADLEDLIGEYWVIREHRAVSTLDYLQLTSDIVRKTYSSILQDAKRDLNKSRYLELLKKVVAKS
ncbi:hypothetical protein [Pedobacter sp. WC2423]|uniref:hypothetical protein n=1 Tax=Pedobacter sp. WC2423 TaxID=3234142 RepID=UPI0034673C3D